MTGLGFWQHGVGLYVKNVAVAVDQLANALRGGDPDETLSSVGGKAMRRGLNGFKDRHYWWWRAMCDALHLIDHGHCESSIEADEGKDPVPQPPVVLAIRTALGTHYPLQALSGVTDDPA